MKYLKKFESFEMESSKEEVCEGCGCPKNECDCSHVEEDSWEDEEEMMPRVMEKKSTKSKKSKPDFLDLDKDGDRKESMKKATREAKGKRSEKSSTKGLTKAQQKLPPALRKAISKGVRD